MRSIFCAVCVLWVAFGSISLAGVDQKDSQLILEDFLRINDPKLDELQQYERRAAIYVKYRDQAPATKSSLKMFLLHAFLTPRHSGASSEALLSDVVPVFEKNRDLFVQILKEVPMLIPSVCGYLANHFGFEDVPVSKKNAFLKKHEAFLTKSLPGNAEICLKAFRS